MPFNNTRQKLFSGSVGEPKINTMETNKLITFYIDQFCLFNSVCKFSSETGKKMHFAICIWGIVRSLHITLESIHQHCLEPITNAGHTYEIFMHTYTFAGAYSNLRNDEMGVQLNFTEWKMLKPDHIFVQDQDLFDANTNYSQYKDQGDPWHNDYNSFVNHIRALNSLHYLATEVEKVSAYTQVDGIVFLRPDVTYLNELPYYLLEFLPNTLFMPDFHRSCRGGEYNDRFAMGDLRSGLAYGKRFEAALEYSKTNQLHSEKFTYAHLKRENVTVKEIPFRFRRTRANGQYHVRDGIASLMAPGYQQEVPVYTTHFVLRLVYTIVEYATENKIYVWNHDDDENLFCKPNPHITYEECMRYRQISHKRMVAEPPSNSPYSTSSDSNSRSIDSVTSPGRGAGTGSSGSSGTSSTNRKPVRFVDTLSDDHVRAELTMHYDKGVYEDPPGGGGGGRDSGVGATLGSGTAGRNIYGDSLSRNRDRSPGSNGAGGKYRRNRRNKRFSFRGSDITTDLRDNVFALGEEDTAQGSRASGGVNGRGFDGSTAGAPAAVQWSRMEEELGEGSAISGVYNSNNPPQEQQQQQQQLRKEKKKQQVQSHFREAPALNERVVQNARNRNKRSGKRGFGTGHRPMPGYMVAE
jgi:hypothetical protein